MYLEPEHSMQSATEGVLIYDRRMWKMYVFDNPHMTAGDREQNPN